MSTIIQVAGFMNGSLVYGWTSIKVVWFSFSTLGNVHPAIQKLGMYYKAKNPLDVLVCQPVLPHELIRINIKIRSIIIIIYLIHLLNILTPIHLLNILTHTLKYIFIII